MKLILLSTNFSDTNIIMRCLMDIKKNIDICIYCNYKNINKILSNEGKATFFSHNHENFDDNYTDDLKKIIDNDSILIPTGFDSIKYLSKNLSFFKSFLKIKIPTPSTIDLLDNKKNFTDFCISYNILHPYTLINFYKYKIENDKKYLLKKIDSAGGLGIYPIDNESTFKKLLKKEEYDSYILQEYIDGVDFAFNGYCEEGRVIVSTIQRFVTPFWHGKNRLRLSKFEFQREVDDIAKKIISISKYSGPINIDFRKSSADNRFYVIEVNPRFWANTHHSIICGVNFVAVALGLEKASAFKEGKVYGNFIKSVILFIFSLNPIIGRSLFGFSLKQLKIYFYEKIDILYDKNIEKLF